MKYRQCDRTVPGRPRLRRNPGAGPAGSGTGRREKSGVSIAGRRQAPRPLAIEFGKPVLPRRRPLPPNVRPVAVIGNKAEKTLLRARVHARGLNEHVWGVAKHTGDGTVAVVSAMGALPRETTLWIESQAFHHHLFDDDAVWENWHPRYCRNDPT